MTSTTRPLQAVDQGRLDLMSIVNVLSAQFTVATNSRQFVRRKRLGTFDRRLDAALNHFLAAMRPNLPGLLDNVDIEVLHDFRVAVRLARATLKLGWPALPNLMRSRWGPAFKWLGDLTTPVLDLDVFLLDLSAMCHWLVTVDPTDLDPLAAHMRGRLAVPGGAAIGADSLAVDLAHLSARGRRRTLLWDLDRQAVATFMFRIRARVKGCGYALVTRRHPIEATLKATDFVNLDPPPTDLGYRKMDLQVDDTQKRTPRLDLVLDSVADDYDVVFLDCPPSISLVSQTRAPVHAFAPPGRAAQCDERPCAEVRPA